MFASGHNRDTWSRGPGSRGTTMTRRHYITDGWIRLPAACLGAEKEEATAACYLYLYAIRPVSLFLTRYYIVQGRARGTVGELKLEHY